MKKNVRRLVILSGVLLFCLVFSFGVCLWGKGFLKETPGRKKGLRRHLGQHGPDL